MAATSTLYHRPKFYLITITIASTHIEKNNTHSRGESKFIIFLSAYFLTGSPQSDFICLHRNTHTHSVSSQTYSANLCFHSHAQINTSYTKFLPRTFLIFGLLCLCREEENLVFWFGAQFNSTLNFAQSGWLILFSPDLHFRLAKRVSGQTQSLRLETATRTDVPLVVPAF